MASVIESKFEDIVKQLKHYTPPINEDDWQAMERLLNANPKTYSGKDRSVWASILIGILLLVVAFFVFKNAIFTPREESVTITADTVRSPSVSDSALYRPADTMANRTLPADTLLKDTLTTTGPEPEETQTKQAAVKKPKRRKNQSKSDSTAANTGSENKSGEEYDFTKDQQGDKSGVSPAATPQTDDNKSKRKRRSFFKKRSQEDTTDASSPDPQ